MRSKTPSTALAASFLASPVRSDSCWIRSFLFTRLAPLMRLPRGRTLGVAPCPGQSKKAHFSANFQRKWARFRLGTGPADWLMRDNRVGVGIRGNPRRGFQLFLPVDGRGLTHQRDLHHLANRGNRDDLETRFHVVGDFGEILLVFLRNEDRGDAR